MEEGRILTFSNISLGGKSLGSEGIMKINASGVGWKSKAGRSIGVMGTDLAKADWISIGRQYQLKLTLKNGTHFKFDGFTNRDYGELKNFFAANFHIDLQPFEYDTTGRNWGEVNMEGASLVFEVNGRPAFELPFGDVAQCALQNKNEVSVGFHQDDTLAATDADQLVELRLFLPADGDLSANDLHQQILSRADIATATGGGLGTLPNVPVLTPRGRYDIDIFPSFLRMHGKTHDYKILFNSIVHLFELPKPDDRHICFMISLDPPLRQGSTPHHHLVLQFVKKDDIEVDLNLKEVESKLPKETPRKSHMEGRGYKIFRKILRELAQKKFTRPGSFQSFYKASAVKCSLKANDGYLFPMERSFIFIHKPPTLIRFADISIVEFARVSAGNTGVNNRTFDLIVSTKGGADYQFTGIQRQEFSNLFNYITAKGIRLKKMAMGTAEGGQDIDDSNNADQPDEDEEEEEEDTDFVAKREDDDPEEEFDEMGADAIDRDEIAALVCAKPVKGKKTQAYAKKKKQKKQKDDASADDQEQEESEGKGKGKEKEKQKGKGKGKAKEKEKEKENEGHEEAEGEEEEEAEAD
jgi:structure-specific recognition protein 1